MKEKYIVGGVSNHAAHRGYGYRPELRITPARIVIYGVRRQRS